MGVSLPVAAAETSLWPRVLFQVVGGTAVMFGRRARIEWWIIAAIPLAWFPGWAGPVDLCRSAEQPETAVRRVVRLAVANGHGSHSHQCPADCQCRCHGACWTPLAPAHRLGSRLGAGSDTLGAFIPFELVQRGRLPASGPLTGRPVGPSTARCIWLCSLQI